jgi:hypothetical protein
MLSDQRAAFPGHERFADALLGLLSSCAAVTEALEHEAPQPGCATDGPVVELVLGIVSFTRTLRATLGALDRAEAEPAAAPQHGGSDAGLQGSLLR